MPGTLESRILKIEVPVVVRVGERQMRMSEVLALVPGSIIELNKRAEDELDLLINNKQIGSGNAVKVGENFGLRVTYIGDVRERIEALGADAAAEAVV
jgi:flagellar motor switch protein FliN/FliY